MITSSFFFRLNIQFTFIEYISCEVYIIMINLCFMNSFIMDHLVKSMQHFTTKKLGLQNVECLP